MGDLVKFPQKKSEERAMKHLLEISNEIDDIIVRAVTADGVKPRDLAGILAHRLGALMRHVEGKDKLLDVCEQVMKKQAAIE